MNRGSPCTFVPQKTVVPVHKLKNKLQTDTGQSKACMIFHVLHQVHVQNGLLVREVGE